MWLGRADRLASQKVAQNGNRGSLAVPQGDFIMERKSIYPMYIYLEVPHELYFCN